MKQEELKELKEGDVINVLCRSGAMEGQRVEAKFVGLKHPSWDKKNKHYHFENIDFSPYQGTIFTCSKNDLLTPNYSRPIKNKKHELENTLINLKDFKKELENYDAPENLGGWSLSNLPAHFWEILGECINNIEDYIIEDYIKNHKI